MKILSPTLALCLLLASSFAWGQNAIESCDLFDEGPNSTWSHVLTATTPDDPNSSDAQSLEIFITSLPAEGANYRVVKTVANGNWNNGNAVPLVLGVNSVTVSAVSFARSVKFQFDSGLVEFTELSLNGDALSCANDLDGVAMETCAGVDAGPNATWPHVVTATTPDDPKQRRRPIHEHFCHSLAR